MQNLTEPESRAEAGARRGSFAFGLLWVAFFTAVACGVSSIVELIFVDFIHGNPHRTQSNALVMMALYTPVIAVIGFLGVLLVFTVTQSIQLYILRTLAKFGLREDWLILMLLPLAALCTWYSYEYLTPSDCNLGINTGPDWTPYEHGLTMSRYSTALVSQALVTVFSLLYGTDPTSKISRRLVLVVSLGLAVTAGIAWGRFRAEQQFKFLPVTGLYHQRL